MQGGLVCFAFLSFSHCIVSLPLLQRRAKNTDGARHDSMEASDKEVRVAGCRAQREPFIVAQSCHVQLKEEKNHRKSVLSWCGATGRFLEQDCGNGASGTRSALIQTGAVEDDDERRQRQTRR